MAAVALVDDFQGTEASKGLRIELSLVSNPANSGGPVFDSGGKVLGLLKGNFLSPVKDEAQRQALYVRPKRDANGNFVRDANGQPQFETAPICQNSGISLVVPAWSYSGAFLPRKRSRNDNFLRVRGQTYQAQGKSVRPRRLAAEQDGSIRIQDLTKVVMGRRRLGLTEERLVPLEASGNVAHAVI